MKAREMPPADRARFAASNGLGVELERGVRRVATRAQPLAASLRVFACGAESVPRKNLGLPLVAACSSALAVRLALEYRQAVKMRTHDAGQQRVARPEQMLRRNRRRRRSREPQ